MDLNYSWSQIEHSGPAQKIWTKVLDDILINKITNQTSNNLHNYPYYQNEVPIYAAISGNPKDAILNPPYKISDIYDPSSRTGDIITPQILDFIKRKREYNKASTFGYEIQIQKGMISTIISDKYPWISPGKRYEKSLDGLHEEIDDFYKYIMPTEEEKRMREEVIQRLKSVVKAEWSDAVVDVFGSFKTDLHLPTSDIDVVIFATQENPLWNLSNIIKKSGISSDCKVLDKATVPIVKMTDKETDVRIDISFNMENGIKSADLIKTYIQKYPKLPHLVFLLKQYLLQRDLNEVWTGGISSYSLILMCVSFMKNCQKIDNLGKLFLSFLEMYGRNYDYVSTGIRTEGDICYVPKEDIFKNMDGSHWSSILCIEDPLNPGNDIGRSSYGALHVKLAFDYAYSTLYRVILPQSSHLYEDQESILGRIIRITPEVMKYRAFIKRKYSSQQHGTESNIETKEKLRNVLSLESDVGEVNKVMANSNNNNPKLKYGSISEKGDIPSINKGDTNNSVSNNSERKMKSLNKKSASLIEQGSNNNQKTNFSQSNKQYKIESEHTKNFKKIKN